MAVFGAYASSAYATNGVVANDCTSIAMVGMVLTCATNVTPYAIKVPKISRFLRIRAPPYMHQVQGTTRNDSIPVEIKNHSIAAGGTGKRTIKKLDTQVFFVSL